MDPQEMASWFTVRVNFIGILVDLVRGGGLLEDDDVLCDNQ